MNAFTVLAIALSFLATACSPPGGKAAWRRCSAQIDAWPAQPAPDCATLHLCANEAPLSAAQQARLQQMVAEGRCAPR